MHRGAAGDGRYPQSPFEFLVEGGDPPLLFDLALSAAKSANARRSIEKVFAQAWDPALSL